MEICGQAQVFIERGDDYCFDHTKVILRKGHSEFFYAKTALRIPQSSRIDVDRLETIPIPTSHVWPLVDPTFTQAPEPLPYACYVKQPSFLNYDDTTNGQDYARQILTEVEACEVLRLHPHPNIARYLGCVMEDGRIKGLCFPKYVTTLLQMLRDKTDFDRPHFLRGIEAGVEHMHKLGLIHGDLNPTNIMLDGDRAVIIDFDSCKREGDRLGSKAVTPGWELGDTEYARRENDLYSLSLIAGALLDN